VDITMEHLAFGLGLVLFLPATTTSSSFRQDPVAAETCAEHDQTLFMRAEALLGRDVWARADEAGERARLGRVHQGFVDVDTMQVTHIVIAEDKLGGFSRTLRLLPFHELRFQRGEEDAVAVWLDTSPADFFRRGTMAAEDLEPYAAAMIAKEAQVAQAAEHARHAGAEPARRIDFLDVAGQILLSDLAELELQIAPSNEDRDRRHRSMVAPAPPSELRDLFVDCRSARIRYATVAVDDRLVLFPTDGVDVRVHAEKRALYLALPFELAALDAAPILEDDGLRRLLDEDFRRSVSEHFASRRASR
jgi:hypothetical protein